MVDNTSADVGNFRIRNDTTREFYVVNDHVQRFLTVSQAAQFARKLTNIDGYPRSVVDMDEVEADGEA